MFIDQLEYPLPFFSMSSYSGPSSETILEDDRLARSNAPNDSFAYESSFYYETI